MTPKQLLESVLLRFHTLLHDDDLALQCLLRQALGAYQDNAAVSETIPITQITRDNGLNSFTVPDDFLARVITKDRRGNYVGSNYNRNLNAIILENQISYRLPLSFVYYVNLRDADFESYELPPGIIGLVQDYLEILISIPNNERRRRIAIAGNVDTSDIPTEEVSFARKKEAEERMKSARSALGMVSIHPQ
ncbi:hypothetical protein [Aliivibrio salmonicida]|uniref:hypothetical protein n=1 Tax=Aliivibrio salmonicida TaxID=40269 RepID=UPI003D0F8FCD